MYEKYDNIVSSTSYLIMFDELKILLLNVMDIIIQQPL
jgi:hypothetical protein